MPPWALITGASQGIGLIAARALARDGYNLIIGARNPQRLAKARDDLAKHTTVIARPVDLSSRPSLEAFLDHAIQASHGEITAAVISYGNPPCEPCTLAGAGWRDWTRAASLYIASTHTILDALARRAKPATRTIIISSFTVKSPHPPLAVADTVRAGLYPLVRLAAQQYPGTLVPILLVMGSIRTPGAWKTVSTIAREQGRDPEEYWHSHVEGLSPLRRAAREEELVELIRFLARAPEYMAGGVVEFHGGSLKSY